MSTDQQSPNVALDQFRINSMNGPSGNAPEQSGGGLLSLISSMTGINLTNLGSISIFSNLNFQNAGIKVDNSVMRAAEGLTMRGGIFAKTAGEVFNKENLMAGVTHNPIESLPVEAMAQVNDVRSMMGEGMPVAAMSYGDLGSLTPSAGGGMSRGQDMGMMA